MKKKWLALCLAAALLLFGCGAQDPPEETDTRGVDVLKILTDCRDNHGVGGAQGEFSFVRLLQGPTTPAPGADGRYPLPFEQLIQVWERPDEVAQCTLAVFRVEALNMTQQGGEMAVGDEVVVNLHVPELAEKAQRAGRVSAVLWPYGDKDHDRVAVTAARAQLAQNGLPEQPVYYAPLRLLFAARGDAAYPFFTIEEIFDTSARGVNNTDLTFVPEQGRPLAEVVEFIAFRWRWSIGNWSVEDG